MRKSTYISADTPGRNGRSTVDQPLVTPSGSEQPGKKAIEWFMDLAMLFPELFMVTQEQRRFMIERLQGQVVNGGKVHLKDPDFLFPDEEMGRVSER